MGAIEWSDTQNDGGIKLPILKTDEDKEVFVNTITNPPAPNEALKQAQMNYSKFQEDSKEYNYISPNHYALWRDNNDVNHVLKSSLSKEEYAGFLKGNILKYQLRLGKKPSEPIERDQEKIKWYRGELDKFNAELSKVSNS